MGVAVVGGEIIRLRMRERLLPDPVWVGPAEIMRNAFPDGFEELQALARAMLRCWLREDFRGFDAGLRRVMRLAPDLGLPLIARVAADVRRCLHKKDSTALASTWARLSRLLDQAVLCCD
jgi:hypothetical protein